MIVVDASAVVELLLRERNWWERVAERLFAPGTELHAPHLLDLEVTQALRRYARTGEAGEDRMSAAFRWYRDLRVYRYPHTTLLQRVWQLRANLTAYDACYVALAEALDAPLLTCDARLGRAAGHRARVEVIAG